GGQHRYLRTELRSDSSGSVPLPGCPTSTPTDGDTATPTNGNSPAATPATSCWCSAGPQRTRHYGASAQAHVAGADAMGEGRDDIADQFNRQIQPYVFGGHQRSASPRLVLLGAQPGAGKSRGRADPAPDPSIDFVYVTGDALRPFHSHYPTLVRTRASRD